MTFKSPLPTLNLTGKRVLLRADLNVPVHNGIILSDFRLQAIKPTLDCILKNNGKIILMTHIDRPSHYDPKLSTQLLLPWFTQHGYTVTFEADLKKAYTQSFGDPKTILLLDNLRFLPGEQGKDPTIAQQLAKLGDYYVNDAFGTIHRTDCSLYQVPQLFAPSMRMIGLLVEKELVNAQKLLHPEHPFTLLVGGNKIHEKIALIDQLLDRIDTLILCPILVLSFLKAQGKSIAPSLYDSQSLELCQKIMLKAQASGVPVITPLDYVVNGTIKDAQQLSESDYGISIGPKTQELFVATLKKSKTILYNGLMGDVQQRQTLTGVATVFEAMATASGYRVIAGGDSAAAAQLLGFADKVSYISTGGGALIAYLGNQDLPALKILINGAKP